MQKPNCLFAFLALTTVLPAVAASANPFVFTIGDAAFVGVVHGQSEIVNGGLVVNAATLFCCGQYPDFTKGIELDVSNLPIAQIRVKNNRVEHWIRGKRETEAPL